MKKWLLRLLSFQIIMIFFHNKIIKIKDVGFFIGVHATKTAWQSFDFSIKSVINKQGIGYQ